MSLQFNVSQLLKNQQGSRTYEIESAGPLDLDDVVATRIHGQVKFTYTTFGIVAAVDADAVLGLSCARCLEDFDAPVHTSFTEEFRPTIDIATGLPSSGEPHAEGVFEISASHVIDLTEALRQNLLLAVDLVPVCREGCKGLCPTCGTNLNTVSCACPPPESSSPFAVLQGLLAEGSDD